MSRSACCDGSQAASVRVELLEIPTYSPGPDSPFPDYGWQNGWGERYPYSLRLDISGQAQPVKHTVVILENRYLRVTLLPDIGGRLYSMFDKIGGKECFMKTPTLKYQNIAQRGAWLAGGIEWNGGVRGHTVNSVDPVTWATRQEADGTASLWIGSLTMPIESRWSVKISLTPERAAMDTEIHYQGPDALPGLYYWWTNTAVAVGPESRFYYFGKRASYHSWPICDGVDMSYYRNRFLSGDMFLMECERDYMGFYDFDRHHGVACTADRFQAMGQKYFTWGNHGLGRYWDTLLNDDGQPYCEVQRGRHSTQQVNDYIDPMTEDVWAESWAPLNQTQGFSAMENDFVLSVVNEGTRELRLTSLRPRQNLRIEAFLAGKSIGQWNVGEASPEHMFVQALPSKCDAVKVHDTQGQLLLDWQEYVLSTDDHSGKYPMANEPAKSTPETADSLYYQAQWQRYAVWPRSSQPALDLLNKVLAMDPGHVGAMQAMAEIHLYEGRYEQAMETVNKALLRDTLNSVLLSLQGRALLALGKAKQAYDAFGMASRRELYRRRGYVGMAEAAITAGDWAEAQQAASRLASEFPNDKWAGWLGVLIARRQGRTDEAKAALSALLLRDPLWTRLHAEALLLGVPVDLGHGRKLGDDSVSAAMPYIEMGLLEDALTILQIAESNEALSPAIRLAHLAYVQEKLGQKKEAAASLKAAESADAAQANAWQTGSIDILQTLCAAHPKLAMPHLMLGNLLASRNRLAEAKTAWQQAADLKMASPIVYRNLACMAMHDKCMPEAIECFEKAWKVGGPELELFAEFDRALASIGQDARRLEVYEQLSPVQKGRSIAANRRVQQMLDMGRYDEALQQLMSHEFFRSESEMGLRNNYLEAVIGAALKDMAAKRYEPAMQMLARGLEYPRNLNTGRVGYTPGESIVQYYLGVCREAMGQVGQAREHYTLAAHEPHWDYHVSEAYEMLAWLALGETGRVLGLMHKLEAGYRNHAPGAWVGTAHVVNYGLAQAAKGYPDRARAVWQEALTEKPDARLVRLHLALPDWVLAMMARKS